MPSTHVEWCGAGRQGSGGGIDRLAICKANRQRDNPSLGFSPKSAKKQSKTSEFQALGPIHPRISCQQVRAIITLMETPENQPSPAASAIQQRNRQAYDRMVQTRHFLTQPVSAQELASPLATLDAKGWLGGNIRGWNVLCLAAGGGRQGPLYCAAGARVTVLDISPAMLELDRQVSSHLGMNYQIIQGEMSELSMFRPDEFDLVAHPVSTCYVSNVEAVFAEVTRVLRPGGLYVSQHKQPMNLQASLEMNQGRYVVETPVGSPAKSLAIGQTSLLREPDTVEFAHSLDAILGGICRAGMIIEAVSEPDHANLDSEPGTMGHRSRFIRPYLRVKARKKSDASSERRIWLG